VQTGLEIAIIGMAGRFPGANDIGQFWRNLRDGVEAITFFTDEELLAAGVRSESPERSELRQGPEVYLKVRSCSMLPSSVIARAKRRSWIHSSGLFLECAWQALEAAGYDSANVPQTSRCVRRRWHEHLCFQPALTP